MVDVEPAETFYLLRPPTRRVRVGGRLPLHLLQGVSLVVRDGAVSEVENVSTDVVDTADHVYLGGHEYVIPGHEADILAAAGYASNLSLVL